jgi:hypothetical protein
MGQVYGNDPGFSDLADTSRPHSGPACSDMLVAPLLAPNTGF